jgi:hypothetical protein
MRRHAASGPADMLCINQIRLLSMTTIFLRSVLVRVLDGAYRLHYCIPTHYNPPARVCASTSHSLILTFTFLTVFPQQTVNEHRTWMQ